MWTGVFCAIVLTSVLGVVRALWPFYHPRSTVRRGDPVPPRTGRRHVAVLRPGGLPRHLG